LNDVSKAIIQLVTDVNQYFVGKQQGYITAYTFDAGPNAVLVMDKEHVSLMLSLVNSVFPPPKENTQDYFGRSSEFLTSIDTSDILKAVHVPRHTPGTLKRIISTSIGDGPRTLAERFDPKTSLMDLNGCLINPVSQTSRNSWGITVHRATYVLTGIVSFRHFSFLLLLGVLVHPLQCAHSRMEVRHGFEVDGVCGLLDRLLHRSLIALGHS
jgi:hypothetical protein